MTTTCNRDGCDKAATHYVAVRVPAMGGPITKALRLIIGLVMCRDHAGDLDPLELLGNDTRAALRVSLMQQRRAMPDFNRAEIEVRRLGDPDWEAFAGLRARQ